MEENNLYNSDDIIKKFFVTKRTLSEWIKNKSDFPKPFKIGRRLLWRREEIDKYLDSRK